MASSDGNSKKKKFFRNPFKSSKKKDGVHVPLIPQTPDRGPPKKLTLETPGAVSAMTTNTVAKRSGLLPGMADEATEATIFEDANSPKGQTTMTASMIHLQSKLQSNRQKASRKSYLANSKWFQKMSAAAFDVVDQDGSGCVDEKELYSGLLLIHLKLGSYAGPAACKVRITYHVPVYEYEYSISSLTPDTVQPVDRERVHAVFAMMDIDQSGSLDREEFTQVMTVLCSNVFTRVMAQWAMTLILVPLMAQYMLSAIAWLANFGWTKITELDNFDELLDRGSDLAAFARDWLTEKIPEGLLLHIDTVCSKASDLIDAIPESVWSSVPVTLMSCILGIIFVPYTIFTIDEYFANMANKKKKELRGE
jgi:Ca2+-binding EF-hand superfamily protein